MNSISRILNTNFVPGIEGIEYIFSDSDPAITEANILDNASDDEASE